MWEGAEGAGELKMPLKGGWNGTAYHTQIGTNR
jgi:hypothetical protein